MTPETIALVNTLAAVAAIVALAALGTVAAVVLFLHGIPAASVAVVVGLATTAVAYLAPSPLSKDRS